jgi:hypothetical protein
MLALKSIRKIKENLKDSMAAIPPDSFFKWLDDALKEKGWSDYRLEKKANLSGAFMPNLRKGAKIGYEACAKIADALGVQRAEMYILAGLDSAPPNFLEMLSSFHALSKAEQEKELEALRQKAKLKPEAKNAKSAQT